MFQRKLITYLSLIIAIQLIAFLYVERNTIKRYTRSVLSKEAFDRAIEGIKKPFKKSEVLPLEQIEKVPMKKFSVTVPPPEWRRINENLTQNSPRDQIDAALEIDGQTYNCTIRISKGGERHWKGRRKSIRLRFPEDHLYNGIREVNLNIPETHRVIIDPLSWEFSRNMGLITPEYDFIRLEINGVNEGVRILYEDIDEHFLKRNGLMGYIFTEGNGLFPFYYRSEKDADYPEVNVRNKKGNTLTEVIWLNKILSYPSTEDMKEQLVQLIDMNQIATWQAHALICGSGHQNIHNVQIYFNSSIQRMQMIPWDLAGFDHWGHEPRETWAMDLDWSNNRFLFRLNQIPEFVEMRNRILYKTLKETLPLERQQTIAREMANRIRYYIYTDDLKQASTERFSNEDFEERNQEMIQWMEKRYNFILAELEKADLRVSVDPLEGSSEVSTHRGLLLALGTGQQSGARIQTIRIPLSRAVDSDRFQLFRDSNGNGKWDKQDRTIQCKRKVVTRGSGSALELSLDETLLPARNVIFDEFFADYWDKGYILQVRPFHVYSQYILLDRSSESGPVLLNNASVEAVNSITGNPVHVESFVQDPLRKFAPISRETRDPIHGLIPETRKSQTSSQVQESSVRDRLQQVGEGQYILPNGTYRLDATWRIPAGETVTIRAGTRIELHPGVSIYVNGVLNMDGSTAEPIVLDIAVPDRPWGALIYHKAAENSRLSNVVIRRAGMASIGGQNFTGGVSVYDASITMDRCVFDHIQADDDINTLRSKTRLLECRFIQSKIDAIDYDFSEGEIVNCYFYKPGEDAIDCGTATPRISGNYVEQPGDKCVSVGEKSAPLIENNFLIGGVYGISIKDSSNPVIRDNTICENKIGISFYIKKPDEFGCPTATIERCIVWNNATEIENLCEARFSISKCVVRGGFPGDKIWTEPPEFDPTAGKSGLKYHLKANSEYAIKGYGAPRGIW